MRTSRPLGGFEVRLEGRKAPTRSEVGFLRKVVRIGTGGIKRDGDMCAVGRTNAFSVYDVCVSKL